MQSHDVVILGQRLNVLAELLNRKPLSEVGLRGWYDVLKECPTEKVCDVLNRWAVNRTEFPKPAEVLKEVQEITLRERAAQQRRDAQAFRTDEKAADPSKYLARVRAVVLSPRPDPSAHWRKVLANSKPGSIAERYALEALASKHRSAVIEREPGQDDEELAEQATR
jgi:hypothetical protein